MRPWSPDELITASEAAATRAGEEPADVGLDFVEDYPRDGLDGFMKRLELNERESLYHLVSEELRAEIRRELEDENAKRLAQGDSFAQTLAKRLDEKVDAELTNVSHQAVELAIAMAEQIVRRSIELDRDALSTAIQTVIHRAKRSTRYTIVVNPDDAEYLGTRPEMLDKLHIERVEIDQRMERGGCVVEADGQEFDYTVAGRLDRLAEVVRESVLEGGVDEDTES